METTAILTLLSNLANVIPANQRATIETLKEQINLLDRQKNAWERERDDLRSQVANLTRELTDLQERHATAQLTTDEFERDGMIWRRTSKGEEGPFCLNHRDVRLTRPEWGWYCIKCRVPVGRR